MVDKEKIETIIENIVSDTTDKINIKCSKEYDNWQDAMTDYATKNNLQVKTMNKRTAILYDEEHDITLKFVQGFINTVFETGDKKYNMIKNLIENYTSLPPSLKVNPNLIVYQKATPQDSGSAWFEGVSKKNKDSMVITITSIEGIGNDRGLTTLFHECVHALDYIKPTPSEREAIQRTYGVNTPANYNTFEGNELRYNDQDIRRKYESEVEEPISPRLREARQKDTEYCIQQGYIQEGQTSKSSDYGTTNMFEDTAETGMMVALGYHNPNGNKAYVYYDDERMNYKNWIKRNPNTAQLMVKEIFGEDVTIEELLKQAE